MIRSATLISLLGFSAAVFARSDSAASQPDATARERQLLERIQQLEHRLAAIEARLAPVNPEAIAPTVAAQPLSASRETAGSSTGETPVGTVSVYFDGYYGWNTNRPAGRLNQLRAFDGTSNGFSINQTGIVLEKTPDVAAGRRWGYRLDLMYGQATETLQGSPLSEPRPHVYRPVYQAYGTYVAPVGKGLTVDFGKWASSLGYEGNYTKDQINYSRSFYFSLLPFYHMGVRTNYTVNDRFSVGYWLVNGANQTEDFNGPKSQNVQVVVKPSNSISWTLQYYAGQEQAAPSHGSTHIVDTYAAWTRGKLTLVGELDYVISRIQPNSAPQRVTGGAAYLKYQFTPRLYFGQRYVRLNDVAGLFSGTAQSLNDVTSTLGYRFGDGFETRLEYRRDFSNAPYFLTSQAGKLNRAQNTITLGMLWWFGARQGPW